MSVDPRRTLEDVVASEKLVMEDGESDLEDYFLDPPYLDYLDQLDDLSPSCQDGDCPPPLFLVPPPPRPPELGDTCSSLSPYESCDNIIIIDSQVQLEETFQNLIIVAVCSAILVIALVLLVACVWRKRKSGNDGCHCSDGKTVGTDGSLSPSAGGVANLPVGGMGCDSLEMKPTAGAGSSEVYDNPNYSHIIIGGKPFFILPTGELSEHVPVPAEGEQLTPRHQGQVVLPSQQHLQQQQQQPVHQHIYEGGGSSTYRSGGSDYETESSTYRPDSDRASNGGGTNGNGGFPPIYEEIDKNTLPGGKQDGGNMVAGIKMNHQYSESMFGGTPQHVGLPPLTSAASDNKGFVRSMAVNNHRKDDILSHHLPPSASLHSESWTSKSLSPRRPPSTGGRMPNRTSESNNSVYYYSDTLRRRGPGTMVDGFLAAGGRDSVQESDSGVSSGRSGHNTSSESTPQPRFELNRSVRGPTSVRNYPVVSSEEDISLDISASTVGMRRVHPPPQPPPLSAASATSPARRQLPTPEHAIPQNGGPGRRHPQLSPSSRPGGYPGSAVTPGLGMIPGHPATVDTEIVVRNTSRREPRAHL